MAINKLFVLVV